MGLYCVDEGQQNLVIWGQNNFEYQRLEILYMPCLPDPKNNVCINKTLDDLQKYLQSPNMYIIRNQRRFDQGVFAGYPIVEESLVSAIPFDTSFPSIVQGIVQREKLEDSVHFLQIGNKVDYEWYSLTAGLPFISTWNQFPNRYKICGLQINISHDQTVTNRQTYDLLMFLGEVGGLNSILMLMGVLIIGWFSAFNSDSYLVSVLYMQSTNAFQTLRSFLKSSPSEKS